MKILKRFPSMMFSSLMSIFRVICNLIFHVKPSIFKSESFTEPCQHGMYKMFYNMHKIAIKNMEIKT